MVRLMAVAVVLVACSGGTSRTGAWPGQAGAGGAAGEGPGGSLAATGGAPQGHPGGAAGMPATGGQPDSTGGAPATGGSPPTGGLASCVSLGWQCGRAYNDGLGEDCAGGGCAADEECGTWIAHSCSTCAPLDDLAYFCPDAAYPVPWGYCSSSHMPVQCIPTTIVGDTSTRVCCAPGSVAQ